jgi:hypothetical protein
MDGRPAACLSTRGGVDIPSFESRRTRLSARAAAVLLAFCLAAWSALAATTGVPLTGVLGLLAVVLLSAAVTLEWSAGIGWALGLLAAQYLASALPFDSVVDARAPVVGAGLLLVAELAYWSIELRSPMRDEPAIHVARARAIGVLVAAGAAAAVVPLLVAELPAAGQPALRVAGAIAVVCVVALLAWLSARAPLARG